MHALVTFHSFGCAHLSLVLICILTCVLTHVLTCVLPQHPLTSPIPTFSPGCSLTSQSPFPQLCPCLCLPHLPLVLTCLCLSHILTHILTHVLTQHLLTFPMPISLLGSSPT